MINISIQVSDHCILLVLEPVVLNFFTEQAAAIFQAEKNETTVAYCGLSAIKYQHRIAHIAFQATGESMQQRLVRWGHHHGV